MITSFRDAGLKIKRANKHIAELEIALEFLKETQTSTVKEDSEALTKRLVHESPNLENVLLDLALIVGDTIHNLHAALDFAWSGVIDQHIPSSKSSNTKFPFRNTRLQVEAALHGIEIDSRCPQLFDLFVSKIQPYDGGYGEIIFVLHNLDISDKHLLVLELNSQAWINELALLDENDQIYDGIRVPIEGIGKYSITIGKGIQIHNHGDLSVHITLKDAGIFKVLPILSLLQHFSNFVAYVVRSLESL